MSLPDASTRIGFVGAGVLGSGLALALHGLGYEVRAVSSRSASSAANLAARISGCRPMDGAQDVADASALVFITTPDRAIEPVAASVRWHPGQWVVHCCGAAGRSILRPAEDEGAATGAFHPFQTFAGLDSPEQAAARLYGVTFALSAQGPLEEFLKDLAAALGGRAVVMDEELRPLYHAAAVLSCGYLVTLLQSAVQVWQAAGYTEEEGLEAVIALSKATVEVVGQLGPETGVTGPLVRGDVGTVRGHLEALMENSPEVARLYGALTEKSLPLALGLGLTSEGETAVRDTLETFGLGRFTGERMQPWPK